MKRINKWKICILFLLFIFLSKSAYAENNLIINAQPCYGIGEEVTFTISINNAPNDIITYGLDLIYDEDVLEYKPQDTTIIEGGLIEDFAGIIVGRPFSNTVRIGGYAGYEEDCIAKGTSGEFLKLTFIVKDCQQSTLTFSTLFDDISGWTVKDGNLFPNNPPPCPDSIDVPPGWSMISLPRLPDDTSVSTLLPNAVVVYGYEKGTGYIRAQKLEKGKGYWILSKTAESYPITGPPINKITQTVNENKWDMIGGCGFSSQASIVDGEIVVIYGFIPGTGYQEVVLESENLEPCIGYWILMNNITDPATLHIE